MNRAVEVLLAGAVVLPLRLNADEAPLRQVDCYNEPGLTIVRFEQGAHNWRDITFMDRDQEFLMQLPKAEGLLQWKYVTAMKVSRVPSSSRLFAIEIDFIDKYDERPKIFEMGLIEEECLTALKQRYSRYLQFTSP